MINNCCYQVVHHKPKSSSLRATISKEKLCNLQNIIKKIITNQATSDLNKLYDEGALISRLCCKVKKKFRGEKLFKRLKQISVAIKKLHQLNISKVIVILLSTFENGMPSKQCGLWGGTRILMATYLVYQLQQFSEVVARLIVKVFKVGQCWLEMNIVLAMVSRVWILTKSLYKSFSRSYQHYRPLVDQLTTTETELLPNFDLPESLDSLLENNYSFRDFEEELVENPGSVMSRKPENEKPITKKRKRPGKQIRCLQEKRKRKIKIV